MSNLSNSSWVPAPMLRVAAASRASGVGNALNQPAAGAGEGDPFARALARSRDSARAETDRQLARKGEADRTQTASKPQPAPPSPPSSRQGTAATAPASPPVPAGTAAVPKQPANPAADAGEKTDDPKDPGVMSGNPSAFNAGPTGKPHGLPPPDSNRSTRTAEALRRAAREAKASETVDHEPKSPPIAGKEDLHPEQPICHAPETEANTQAAVAAAVGKLQTAVTPEANAAAAGVVRDQAAFDGLGGPPGGSIVKRSALGDTRWQPAGGPIVGSAGSAGSTGPAAPVTEVAGGSMALAVQHAGATPVVQSAASLEERSPRRMGVASSLDTAVTASAAPGDRGPMAPPLDNLMATTASTQVAQAKSADTPEAALQARPGTADFAPQLGSQLAVWVRDGVQEARLQLNPADMGPVRVEIQLDGNAAQVSLSASNSETRQALEAAMPSLAGSLRELGLTLAGGGVFDQTPQPREQAGSSSPSPLSAAAANAGSDGGNPPGAVFQPRRRGLVDLVA